MAPPPGERFSGGTRAGRGVRPVRSRTLLMVELKPGDQAPAFALPDENGEVVSTKDLKGSRYVVYFYPKHDTPGCTTEACQFTDNFPQLEMRGVQARGAPR